MAYGYEPVLSRAVRQFCAALETVSPEFQPRYAAALLRVIQFWTRKMLSYERLGGITPDSIPSLEEAQRTLDAEYIPGEN